MKHLSTSIMLIAVLVITSACGNQTKWSMRTTMNRQSGTGTSQGSTFLLGSGNTTGSPSNNSATSGASGSTGAQGGAANLTSNPFARSTVATATDPQQCAALYNSYSRFEANFEQALADITTCLNRVMLAQNPTLNQQYQILQQYQQPYYGGAWGAGGIAR